MTGHLCEKTECPLAECRRYRKVMRYRRDTAKAAGGSILARVPTAEVADLIREQLAATGFSQRQLSTATGINALHFRRILAGKPAWVKATTRDLIRDLPLRVLVRPVRLPPLGTVLRLQALAAAGYSVHQVARECGARTPLDVGSKFVERALAERVLDAVKRLGETPGPTPRAGVIARNKGWLQAGAYDPELFYDVEWDGLNGVPTPVTAAERVEDAADLLAGGSALSDACHRAGIDSSTVRPGQWATLALSSGYWRSVDELRPIAVSLGYNWDTVKTAAHRSGIESRETLGEYWWRLHPSE